MTQSTDKICKTCGCNGVIHNKTEEYFEEWYKAVEQLKAQKERFYKVLDGIGSIIRDDALWKFEIKGKVREIIKMAREREKE